MSDKDEKMKSIFVQVAILSPLLGGIVVGGYTASFLVGILVWIGSSVAILVMVMADR